ncbi:MAG: glycosyltransferase [Roseibium sp.]|uniref:glycosyltransferase n=1 Tax=Roseibium sp. TaxID=1936156 RepID=UPI00262AA8E4|nr:glycosyltransferase [Roseibium sp.]MCV0425416.1 glycosyltransferase [Roseibium sp.]
MHIVFVHRDGPGQFVHLARRLICEGWSATLISQSVDRTVPGVRTIRYSDRVSRGNVSTRNGSPAHVPYVAAGRRVADILHQLVREGRKPDLIMGHIGWGGMMFVKDILPDTPAVGFCEYYFQPQGGDVGFAPSETVDLIQRQTLRLRNAVQLATLDQIDCGISPTNWQKSRYPAPYHPRIIAQHEGIDTNRARPDHLATLRLPDGTLLASGDPVVTFAARNLEPYRGFPQFMRAAARVARKNPTVRFVVAGGDGTSYGQSQTNGKSWRDLLMKETEIPPERIHFLGQIPHHQLIRLFQISAAHVYLTYPFVLSWSFLEAMACGAPIIASATAPVEEVMRDGVNGQLTDFWDTEEIAVRIEHTLTRPPGLQQLRDAARQSVVSRFELNASIRKTQLLLQRIVAREARRTLAPVAGLNRSPAHSFTSQGAS